MIDLRIIARCALILAGATVTTASSAQVMAPSAAASAAADKAQKETDRTMYWIRVLAATPAPKAAAAPKPVAAAPAPKVAAAPERVKVASAAPTPAAAAAPSTADVSNATLATVVSAAPPAAPAPSLAAATGAASPGNNSATTAQGVDAAVSSAGLAASIAAPAVAATAPIEVPPVEEEPDPGLIMTKSVDPQFPVATMRRLRKGEVEVKFEVNADGVVDSVTVMKTTNAGLNTAAMDAVHQWRFKPTPKAHTAAVVLAFNLDA